MVGAVALRFTPLVAVSSLWGHPEESVLRFVEDNWRWFIFAGFFYKSEPVVLHL